MKSFENLPTQDAAPTYRFKHEFGLPDGSVFTLDFVSESEIVTAKEIRNRLEKTIEFYEYDVRLITVSKQLTDAAEFHLGSGGILKIVEKNKELEPSEFEKLWIVPRPKSKRITIYTKGINNIEVETYADTTIGAFKKSIEKKIQESDVDRKFAYGFEIYDGDITQHDDEFPVWGLDNLNFTVIPALAPESVKLPQTKAEFLDWLEMRLNSQTTTKAEILSLFAEIKNPNGAYAYIHEQRHSAFDSFRLFFCAERNGEEKYFWHTATYQKAVKMLKDAYVSKDSVASHSLDNSDANRKHEASELIDYVRGNAMRHKAETSTRKSFGK